MNHYGVKGWLFNMACPGNTMSTYYKGLLMLKNESTVNKNLRFDDICKEKYVSVAYNNEQWFFEVSIHNRGVGEVPSGAICELWPVLVFGIRICSFSSFLILFE